MAIQAPQRGETLIVSAPSGLYLRVQPSTDVGWSAAVPFNARVIATGGEQNGFAEVTYGGQTGWASEAWLSREGMMQQVQQVAQQMQSVVQQVSQVQPTSVTAGLQLVITGQDVLFRSAPVLDGQSPGQGNVLFGTNKGEIATTLGPMQNGYTNVSVRGRDGWIATQYLATKEAAPSDLGITKEPPPVVTEEHAPPKQGIGMAGWALGLGILIAVGYFMMK